MTRISEMEIFVRPSVAWLLNLLIKLNGISQLRTRDTSLPHDWGSILIILNPNQLSCAETDTGIENDKI